MKSKKSKKKKKDKGPPVHMSSWSEVSGNTSPSELMYFSKEKIQKYDFFRRVKDLSGDVRTRSYAFTLTFTSVKILKFMLDIVALHI